MLRIFGNYEPEIIKGKYNMEINEDLPFEACPECPNVRKCADNNTCKLEEEFIHDMESLSDWIDDHKVDRERGDK